MREERIELSQGERDRLKVLYHVEQGYLTRAEAGQQVQVSAPQVRRGLRGGVELERRLDATLWVRFRGSYLSLRPSPPPAPPSAYGLRGLPPSKTRNQNANTIPLPPPLEEDISIRQKSGHFYFALTVLEHSKFMIFSASAGNGLRNEGKVLYLVGSYPYAGPVPASGMGPGSSEVF